MQIIFVKKYGVVDQSLLPLINERGTALSLYSFLVSKCL